MTLGEAVRLMESRSSQISVLPVVEAKQGILQGLFRLHDAYQPSFS
jgi:CBS domain-containing protein